MNVVVLLLTALALVGVVALLFGPIRGVSLSTRFALLMLDGEAGEVALLGTTNVSDIKAQIKSKLTEARNIADAAAKESRELTDEERDKVKTLMDESGALKKRMDTAIGDDEMRKAMADLGDGLGLDVKGGDGQSIDDAKLLGDGKTLGEKFVNSPEFKSWLEQVAPNGQIPNDRKGLQSPPIGFRGFKDLITGASPTSAGALVQPQWLGLIDPNSFGRQLTVLDLVTRGQTTSDAIHYAREVAHTNNAAPVPEATTEDPGTSTADTTTGAITTTTASGTKPKSIFTLERVTEAVKTIAHWIPATKRALSDAGQIRTLIDNFLRYGLNEELEDQILLGDGTDENFTGILNTPGVQVQPFDTDLLVTTRKAKTKVRTVGRAAMTAYLVNPEDNEKFDLLRDNSGGANTGAFLFGGPAQMGVQTLWGVPRVESEAVPVGTALAGDFRRAVIWDREQASISASDSHQDFFIRNLVAILAEMRAGFGVLRPAAFVQIDLTAA